MDLFTRQHLNELVENSDQHCVSIYLPTHRAAPETEQDPIRFKNLLQIAKRELEHRNLDPPSIRRLFAPAESWFNDFDFWRHQDQGLAVFVTKSSQRRFRLPRAFDETVRVEDHFHVNPLLPLLQSNGVFYLLAVSQKRCRLFFASRDAITELEDANLPHDLKSALGWWQENELNLHSMQQKPQSRGGDETAIYHSHFEDTTKQDLKAYFRKIDAGVADALRGEQAPLVFAGVEYLFPIYSEVNNYPVLCDRSLTGNPDQLAADSLHSQAWEIVRPIFENRQKKVLDNFGRAISRGSATDDIAHILHAARSGLVETLIIPQRVQLWGKFDPGTGEVEITDGPQSASEDLLDRAVLLALRTSGEVLVVDAEVMPNGSKAAARLRAPISAVTT